MVASREAYLEMGMRKMKKENEVTNKEVKEMQRKMNGHMSMIIKGVNI